SRVAARSGKAGDQTESYRVHTDAKDDWNRCGGGFGRERSGIAAERSNNGNTTANKFSCQRGKAIVLAFQPMVLDHHVLAFDIANFIDGMRVHGPPRRRRTYP